MSHWRGRAPLLSHLADHTRLSGTKVPMSSEVPMEALCRSRSRGHSPDRGDSSVAFLSRLLSSSPPASPSRGRLLLAAFSVAAAAAAMMP